MNWQQYRPIYYVFLFFLWFHCIGVRLVYGSLRSTTTFVICFHWFSVVGHFSPLFFLLGLSQISLGASYIIVHTAPPTIVGQIMGPIVQIVIHAPNLARMFVWSYWSNLPDGPLENPRWRPFFQDGHHFHYTKLFFK